MGSLGGGGEQRRKILSDAATERSAIGHSRDNNKEVELTMSNLGKLHTVGFKHQPLFSPISSPPPLFFRPRERSEAAVLKPGSGLGSEEGSQPWVCQQPVSLAEGTDTSGPFSPRPHQGNCRAGLGLRAECGQFETLFSDVSSCSGINPFGKGRGNHTFPSVTAEASIKDRAFYYHIE